MDVESDESSQEAFALALMHRSAMMAVIVAMVRDLDAAEDIFQDTMLEIVRSFDSFETDRDFLPWAKGVARNMVMRHWASGSKKLVSMDRRMLETAAEVMMADLAPDVWESERTAMRLCLQRLTDRHRELFLLRYGENLKGPSLAEKVGIKVKSLRTTLLRIRRFLRECIDARLGTAAAGGEPSHE